MKKCGTRVDRISQLPDDIIAHIFSFLPLKKAAATSILSPRWLHLWKYTPKLNFVDQWVPSERRTPGYIKWVNSVIESHKALTLQEFSIDFLANKVSWCHIAKWLEFALSRRVERLDLTWEKMTVAPELEEISKEANLQTTNFESLKVLCLKRFGTSGEAIELFIRNCPLLERLVVQSTYMTSDLEVVSNSLRHLDIRSRSSENSIKVLAPNMTWLTIDLNSEMVSLENVPKLVNMNFSCRFQDTLHDFANAAAQLETLIIMFYNTKAPFSVPQMPKLKKLVVYYRDDYHRSMLFPVTHLIWASPCLEEFKLEISAQPVQERIFEVPKVGPTFRHQHLKRFVLSGDRGGFCDRIELVRYIVDNCAALEEIVVGQFDLVELVRDMVDYCVPLERIFFREDYPHEEYVPSGEERRAFEKTMQLLQLPSHIKLILFSIIIPITRILS